MCKRVIRHVLRKVEKQYFSGISLAITRYHISGNAAFHIILNINHVENDGKT